MSQSNESSTELENPNNKTFKRLNKNRFIILINCFLLLFFSKLIRVRLMRRPQELSSKKPVSVFRNVFQVKKNQEPIDPRFNSAFGEYKPEFFRKRYSFINDLRMREKEVFYSLCPIK